MTTTKHRSKKYLRKEAVADRYSVNIRTVDRMAEDGRIPPPIYRGKFPIWDEDGLDEADRRAVAAAYQPTTRKQRDNASV